MQYILTCIQTFGYSDGYKDSGRKTPLKLTWFVRAVAMLVLEGPKPFSRDQADISTGVLRGSGRGRVVLYLARKG